MEQSLKLFGMKAIPRLLLLPILSAMTMIASATDTLYGGMQLSTGQSIGSAKAKYSLVMQTDGNLVMYRSDGTVRHRLGSGGQFANMQIDGNFVQYTGLWYPVFDTETSGNPGAFLHIQDDGNLVVYSKDSLPLWNIGAMGCYRFQCRSSAEFEQFEMRLAITKAAYGAYMIGASYTMFTGWKPPTWGTSYANPVRGLFRCDTFVLWTLSAPPYLVQSAARTKWKNFIQEWLHNGAKTPTLVFRNLPKFQ